MRSLNPAKKILGPRLMYMALSHDPHHLAQFIASSTLAICTEVESQVENISEMKHNVQSLSNISILTVCVIVIKMVQWTDLFYESLLEVSCQHTT